MVLYVILIASWVLISGQLLMMLWLRHRNDAVIKKVFWSVVILFPLFGWIMYGGFYTPPGENSVKAQGGASGWYPFFK